MKFKVYQQGGGLVYTPFIPEQWASRDSSGRSASSSESKIDPLDKEIIDLMKNQDLLPSDIQMIYNRLIQFHRKAREIMIDGDYSAAMPGMLQIMQLASVARSNKSNLNDFVTEVRKHDAGSEVAMDPYGRMWVRSAESGDISVVSPNDFDPEKYVPLSNSEWAHLRRTDPTLAFNDNMPSMDVVGQKDVRQEIDAIINNFGKVSKDQFALGSKIKEIAGDVIDGDIYKIGTTYSKAELQNFSSLLFSQLSTEAQNLLRARSALNGIPVLDYLDKIIFSQTESNTSISYEASASKSLNGSEDGDSDSDLKEKDNYQIRFATDQGSPVQFWLTPTASKINEQGTFRAEGYDFGPMLNMDQLPVGQMNLQQLLFGNDKHVSALATSIRSTDVTFGNRLLDYSELPTVMFNNESLTTKVYLPYRNENGHFVPDFQKIADFNAYMEEYKPNMSKTERNALLQKHNLSTNDVIPSEDGKSFTLRGTMAFLAFSAYAGDDTLKLSDNDKLYLHKVDRAKGRTLADGYNKAVKYNDVYANKNASPINKGFKKSESGDFWEGVVFIPCPDAFYAMNSTKDQPIRRSDITDYSSKIIANNALNEAVEAARSDPNYEQNRNIGQFR